MTTESEKITERLRTGEQSSRFPITLDGRPLAEALAAKTYTDSIAAEVKAQRLADSAAGRGIGSELEAQRLASIMKERGRDSMSEAAWDHRMGLLRRWRADNPRQEIFEEPAAASLISTDPVETGVRAIDKAGQTVPFGYGGPLGIRQTKKIPELESLPFDSEVRIRADNAQKYGVDYRHGLPLWQRAKIAFSPPDPESRSRRIQEVMSDTFAQIPDELPPFRYDSALQEYWFLRPDEESPGKYRWTAMDGTGIEPGDIGDMMNLGEIGGVAGGIGGTLIDPTKGVGRAVIGGKRFLTFYRTSRGGQAAFGGFSLGSLGRVAGDAMAYAIEYSRSGEIPDWKTLVGQGWNDVQIEAFATMMGEAGAYILRTGPIWAQEAAAWKKGKRGVYGDQRAIDIENVNLRETQEDLHRVANVLGRYDLPTTPGEATHSINIKESESFGFANAPKAVQRELTRAHARGLRTTSDYINVVFDGNKTPFKNKGAFIESINDTITDAQSFIAQTTDGVVHVGNKAKPDLDIQWVVDAGSDYWRTPLKDVSLRSLGEESIDLSGFGLRAGLFRVTAREAATYGKGIASGSRLSLDEADNVWKKIDEDEAVGKLEWSDSIEPYTDSNGKTWLQTSDGSPVVKTAEPPRFTERLLDDYTTGPARQGASGKLERNKEFTRFLRRPFTEERGQVAKEVQENPWSLQRLKEQILDDYEHAVRDADGNFSIFNFEVWKEEVGPNIQKFFSPDEMRHILRPRGLGEVVAAGRATTDSLTQSLSKQLDIPLNSVKWKDPSVTTIYNQLKGQGHRQRVHSMRLLDRFGMGDSVRSIFKEDLRADLLTKTKASNITGYNTWFKNNIEVIEDVIGGTYTRDLRVIGNILKRRSDRNMIRGTGADINPSVLALTRVVFGPLSRAQRFFSAARRAQVRTGAAKAADIIVHPDQLRELVRLEKFDVSSRLVARVVQDLGGWNLFGDDILGFIPTGGDEFDSDNPEHRDAVADYVMFRLDQDEDLNPDVSAPKEVQQ